VIHELRLPWTKPPASANDRDHWRVKARKVADIRQTVARLVHLTEFTRTPAPYAATHIRVGLHYWPRDRRHRDPDNLVVPFFKACVDGLVDADVVADDTPQYVTREFPVIHEPDGDPRLVLTIEEIQP
jgi:crossover junction endodeoxyribonuclease RusA